MATLFSPLLPDGRSYCANSDLFFHDASLGVRHLSEEAYRRNAEAMRQVLDELDEQSET